tara:strand:+ start:190 stop:405 length:216 start_codon:yes stop_codon:yes gene_type:complete
MADKIKSFINTHGLSIRHIANKIGMPESTLGLKLSGIRTLSDDEREKVLAALAETGKSIRTLREGEKNDRS